MQEGTPERQEISQEIGQRIRRLRKERGLSLEALALKCDMNAAFLGHIERGLRCPTVYTLKRISSGLEVELVEFLIDDKAVGQYEAAVQHFSSVLSGLTPYQIEKILQILDASVALIKNEQK